MLLALKWMPQNLTNEVKIGLGEGLMLPDSNPLPVAPFTNMV